MKSNNFRENPDEIFSRKKNKKIEMQLILEIKAKSFCLLFN